MKYSSVERALQITVLIILTDKYVMQYLAWCVLVGLHHTITILFMTVVLSLHVHQGLGTLSCVHTQDKTLESFHTSSAVAQLTTPPVSRLEGGHWLMASRWGQLKDDVPFSAHHKRPSHTPLPGFVVPK